MESAADEKALALSTAYRALVLALIESKTLDSVIFDRHANKAIERLAAVGETKASSLLANMLGPLLADIRRVSQPGGGS